jgi:hypothetical protein
LEYYWPQKTRENTKIQVLELFSPIPPIIGKLFASPELAEGTAKVLKTSRAAAF